MTDTTAQASRVPRSVFRPDRVYLGWQYAPRHPDPGPSPRRPTPPQQQQLNSAWVAAQRREDKALHRPVRLACGGALTLAAALLALWLAGVVSPLIAGPGIAACLLGAAACGHALWQGARTLNERIAAERRRLELIRAEQERRLFASQEEHARAFREWQARSDAYQQQRQWYPVSLPAGVRRIDVAGGTLCGWSALVTTIGAARLSTGGEMTIIDLSAGAVAHDLVALARQRRIDPLVWILPGDLPRLDLGTGLDAAAMADVLSLVMNVMEEHGSPRDLAGDKALLERLIDVLGAGAGTGTGPDGARGPAHGVTVAEVTAALRALAQAGDPREDIERGLTDAGRLDAIGRMAGAAGREVIERAGALESQLRKLEAVGTDPSPLPAGRLRVLATDLRAGIRGNRVLGTYVVSALSHMLRHGGGACGACGACGTVGTVGTDGADEPWRHTVMLAGAEKLPGDVLDRLCDACEHTGTGLVLGYRSLPPPVRERIGRGNAAVAFMRPGSAEDATVAVQRIGTGYRFVLSPLTATVGASVTDTTGDPYTSTVGATAGAADPVPAPQPAGETTVTGSTVSESITTSSAWGMATSRVAGGNGQPAGGQRSREFAVEPGELQQLPPSALIVTGAGIAGAPAAEGPRAGASRAVLADANPAIAGLPTATMPGPDEAERPEAPGREGQIPAPGGPVRPATDEAPGGRDGYPPPSPPPSLGPPPNLGPPPDRLDWRSPRRS